MGTTPLGFRYPDPSAGVDVAGDLLKLGSDVDTYLGGNTGRVTCAASSGYTSSLTARLFGPLVILSGSITKASGNFSGGPTQIATLPGSGYAPLDEVRLTAYGYPSGTGEAAVEIGIGQGGTAIFMTYLGAGSFSQLFFNGAVSFEHA